MKWKAIKEKYPEDMIIKFEKSSEITFGDLADKECFFSDGLLYIKIFSQDLKAFDIDSVNAISVENAGLTKFADDETVIKAKKSVEEETDNKYYKEDYIGLKKYKDDKLFRKEIPNVDMLISMIEEDETLYISSGTWSLMGTEQLQANCSRESMVHNFTNEGGYSYRYRFLKNIMGLWMIQSVRKELAPDMSFSEICTLAEKEEIISLVDVNDERFLTPDSMVEEVRTACWETMQQVPKTIGEIATVIYNSLANCYAEVA